MRVTKDAKTMPSDSLAIAAMPPSARSRVTNGSAVFPTLTGARRGFAACAT